MGKPGNYINLHGTLIEVSLDVYQVYHQYSAHEKYLYRKDHKHGVVNYSEFDSDEMNGEEILWSPAEGVEESAIKNIMIDVLYEALSNLTDEEYHIIYDLFFLQKTEAEVGAELGISQPAVSQRKASIVKKLQKYFNL